MINLRYKIIGLSFLLGLIFWLGDAIGDFFYKFPDETFIRVFIYDAPGHEFGIRLFVVALFILFGIIASKLITQSKEAGGSYQQVFENVNDALFIRPFNNPEIFEKFTEVNRMACKQLGYSKEELLQLSPDELVDTENKSELPLLMKELQSKKHVLFETVLLSKDGLRIPVEINAHVFELLGNPVCLAVVRDISARQQAEEALRKSERQLRILATQLLKAQELERSRISKELHDELGQGLMFLKFQISSVHSRLPQRPIALRKECEELLTYLDGVIDNVRRLSRDLKPWGLEEMGITMAIKFLVEESSKLYGIKAACVGLDPIDPHFPPQAQLNIYRIFQESLTNIGKYAQATEVSWGIKRLDDKVIFTIIDNGRGFDAQQVTSGEVARKGTGLSIMKERVLMLGGNLDIQSQKDLGTQITLTVSLDAFPLDDWRDQKDATLSNLAGR